MNELIFLAEAEQNSEYSKNGQSTIEKSVDSVLQEKEKWEGADDDKKHKRTMEAEPGLQRLNIERVRKR